MLDCMQNGRSSPGGSAKAEAPVLYIIRKYDLVCVHAGRQAVDRKGQGPIYSKDRGACSVVPSHSIVGMRQLVERRISRPGFKVFLYISFHAWP